MGSLRPRSAFHRNALRVLPAVLFAVLAGAAVLSVLPLHSFAVFAQTTATRTVQGKVIGKDGSALKGAIVYLKDSHTLAVKSAVTIDDGTYRFGQLAQNTDYEIWAADDGQKSGTKNISAFDNRKEFDITLKIDK